jgi:hypothetical protein
MFASASGKARALEASSAQWPEIVSGRKIAAARAVVGPLASL